MERPDAEKTCFCLVNEARKECGLKPLRFDPKIRQLARIRAAENRSGPLSHHCPVHGSLWDRLRDAGVPFACAGENLARAGNVWAAHCRLMDSDGHRRNILRARFTRAGIGVVDAPGAGVVVAQIFLNRLHNQCPVPRGARAWVKNLVRNQKG